LFKGLIFRLPWDHVREETPMMVKHEFRLFFCALTLLALCGCLQSFSRVIPGKSNRRSDAKQYFDRGLSLASEKEYDRAIRAFTKALEIDPKYDDAYWGRGVAWAMKGDPDRAIADYNRALTLNPAHAWAYNNRGCAWRDKGDYDRAITDYTKDLEMHPFSAETYHNRAVAWALKGNFQKALSDARNALRLKPENEAYQFSVSRYEAFLKKANKE